MKMENKAINEKPEIISVIEKIKEVKETVCKGIRQFLNEDYIVGFSISCCSINRTTYKEELTSAKLEIKNNEVISQDDLEIESKNW